MDEENISTGGGDETTQTEQSTQEQAQTEETGEGEDDATETTETQTATQTETELALTPEERAFLLNAKERGLNLGELDKAIGTHAEKASAEAEAKELTDRAAAKIEAYGQKLIERINADEITEAEARALYNRELETAIIREENAALKAKLEGNSVETTVSKIATEFPYANVELLRLAAKQGTKPNELRTLANEEHKRVSKLLEGERAKYATEKDSDKAKTGTVPAGSSAGGRATGMADSGDSTDYWSKRFGN